jgi:hypothetical protein
MKPTAQFNDELIAEYGDEGFYGRWLLNDGRTTFNDGYDHRSAGFCTEGEWYEAITKHDAISLHHGRGGEKFIRICDNNLPPRYEQREYLRELQQETTELILRIYDDDFNLIEDIYHNDPYEIEIAFMRILDPVAYRCYLADMAE